MEVPMIRCSQVNIGRSYDNGFFNSSKNLNAKMCGLGCNKSKGFDFCRSQSLVWPSKSAFRFTLRASSPSQTEIDVISENASRITSSQPFDDVKLYVGLPLDTVSNSNVINHERAIAAGLKALKLLGVDGVELPVYWGIVEKGNSGQYEWSSYLAVVEMVRKLDLKLHVSICFHSSEDHKIPLPDWVSRIGETDQNIYFTDRSGQQYKGCLSLSVDDLPVLNGKTPVDVYGEFCHSFKTEFSSFFGSTITGVSISLGPDGELRYPSHHRSSSHFGAGEFQCYDKYMLTNLKQHAEAQGNPLWGLGGPHDSPAYDQNPISSHFLMENGGSWESPYGNFFLSWYSSLLASHADRILSLAASAFKETPITVSGKLPLMHSWYRSRSHPSEVTAGVYNTDGRDGYEAIAEIFSRRSCKMILPGMDLSDERQPSQRRGSPESLLKQIASACRKHGVGVCGENTMVCGGSPGFEQMKKMIVEDNVGMSLLTYQRMGAEFFSPDHFPIFAQFVRSVRQPERSLDDLPAVEERAESVVHGMDRELQAA